MHPCVSCVCIYLFFFCLFFLSIPNSWLHNSLFLLDTGGFLCTTTSFRSCHLTFLPGFHRLSEYACFSWLSTEMLCLSVSVDFLSLLDMYWSVFLVLLVHRQTNRHSWEISEIVPAHTAREHMQRSLAHPWAAVVTSVTLMRSRSSYIHTYTDTQVCMFVCLLFLLLFLTYLTAGWLTLIRSRSSYNHTYHHAYLCVYV
jgi:hypothetical protein